MYHVQAVILFLLFFLPHISVSQEIHTENTPNPAETASKKIQFGVISLNHPLVMYRQFLPFTDFLSKKLSSPIELFLARDYESIVLSLRRGQIDFALLAGVSYVTVNTINTVTPVCSVISSDGTPMTRSVFISRADRDDINTIKDFSNKSFAFGSLYSTSSYLVPLGHLHSQGIVPAAFTSYDNLPTQDAVVRSVLRGNHDGGSISLGTFKRFSGFGLQEVAKTEPYRGFVIVASNHVPEKMRNELKKILLTLDYNDAEVSQLSARWSPLLQHGFAPTPKEAYSSIHTLMEKLHQLGLY